MHDHHDDPMFHLHEMPYTVYVLVWAALLLLTGLTVTAAGVHFGRLNIIIAMAIAAAKSTLVLTYFMHLKQDAPFFRVLLAVTLGVFLIFVGLTFSDVFYR